jgi:large subunit ribosomal protein L22
VGIDRRDLLVARAYVDEGPRWKRILPKDRGRAFRILKRTSHITIELGIAPPRERRPAPRKPAQPYSDTPAQGALGN